MKTARGRRLFLLGAALPIAVGMFGIVTSWAEDVVIRDQKGEVIIRFPLPKGATLRIEQEAAPPKVAVPEKARLTADGFVAEKVVAAGGSFSFQTPDGNVHDSLKTPVLPEGFQVTEVRLRRTGTTDQIVSLLKSHLLWIGKLTAVDVSGAAIDDSHAPLFKELKGLKKLSLADTLVTDGFLPVLRDLRELEELDLSGTLVTGGGIAQLSSLQKLHTLRLDRTAISECDVAGVMELKKLKTVSLGYTLLDDAALSTLERWQGLEKLNLERVRISKTGAARLQAALATTDVPCTASFAPFTLPHPTKFRERKVRDVPPSADEQAYDLRELVKRIAPHEQKPTLDMLRLRANRLWDYARELPVPGSYVAYREARDAAARAGHVLLVEQIVDAVEALYKIDVGEWRAAGWRGTAADWGPLTVSNVFAELLRAADEADVEGRPELAAEYLKLAEECVARFELGDRRSAVEQAAERSAWRKREASAVADAMRNYRLDPQNRAAAAIVGKYWCTVEGNWPKGLEAAAFGGSSPWTAGGSNAADNWNQLHALRERLLSERAEGVVNPGGDWTQFIGYGDRWYDAAKKLEGRERQELLRAAAEWYVPLADLLPAADKRRDEILTRVGSREMLDAQNHTFGYGPSQSLRLELMPGLFFRARRVPAGEFTMGTDTVVDERADPEHLNDERPAHSVVIPQPFYYGTTLVTYRQYDALMGKTSTTGTDKPLAARSGFTYHDAEQYVRVLNLSPIGERYRFRLSTEAEWEYVRTYESASEASLQELSDSSAAARAADQAARRTHGLCNSLGIFDAGHAGSQWCRDWYDRDYYAVSPRVNPLGPVASPVGMRVVRGDSMLDARPTLRTAARPDTVGYFLRLVVEPRFGPTTTAFPRPRIRPVTDQIRAAHFLQSHGATFDYVAPPGVKRNWPWHSIAYLPDAPIQFTGITFGESGPVRSFDVKRLLDFPEITRLGLAGLKVRGEQLAQLTPLAKLESLDLTGAILTDDDLAPLGKFPQLKHLDLSYTQVGDRGLKELTALPQLGVLVIRSCPVTDVGIENLPAAPQLSGVIGTGTNLTDQALQSFAKIKNLRFVELQSCPNITDKGITEFRKTAPQCRLAINGKTEAESPRVFGPTGRPIGRLVPVRPTPGRPVTPQPSGKSP